MSSLFRCINNFASLLVLGKNLTCTCTCGSKQVYHVVPYTGAQFTVDSRINWSGGIMTQQDVDIMFGLFLGLFLFWVFLWLDAAWRSDCGFWSLMPRLRSIRSFFGRLYPKTMQDSRGTTIQDGNYYFDARHTSLHQ